MNKPILINIDGNDDEAFLNANKMFLRDLKSLYISFKNSSDLFIKQWNEIWKNNKNFDIVPEKNKYLSPITILDADWGSGKSYFIESLIKNCIEEKINLENECNFKRIIVIDLWDYINNDNMINDVVYDVYNKLVPNTKKLMNKVLEWSSKGLAISFSLCNIFTKDDISSNISLSLSSKFNKKNITNKVKKLKNHLKKIDKTILIFDNIERLEDKSIEIIKLIQKITNIDNLLVILLMNKKKFILNEEEGKIEKYITLGKYFFFKQDYLNLLLSNGINEEDAELINRLLKTKGLNKKFLSIRDVEYKLSIANRLNFYLNLSKYDGIIYLNKHIWSCENEIKEVIKKDFDSLQKLFSDFYKESSKIINSIFNIFPKYINHVFYNNITTEESEKINLFFHNYDYYKSIDILANKENIIEIRKIIENIIVKKEIINKKSKNQKDDSISKWKNILNDLNDLYVWIEIWQKDNILDKNIKILFNFTYKEMTNNKKQISWYDLPSLFFLYLLGEKHE